MESASALERRQTRSQRGRGRGRGRSISSRRRGRAPSPQRARRRRSPSPEDYQLPEHLRGTIYGPEYWNDVNGNFVGFIFNFYPNNPAFRIVNGRQQFIQTDRPQSGTNAYGVRRPRHVSFSRVDLSLLMNWLFHVRFFEETERYSYYKTIVKIKILDTRFGYDHHRWITMPAVNVGAERLTDRQRGNPGTPNYIYTTMDFLRNFRDDLENKEHLLIGNDQYDTDNSPVGCYERMSVVMTYMGGGCGRSDKKDLVSSMVVRNYKAKNNDCLITTLCRVFNLSNKSYTKSKQFFEYLKAHGINHEFGSECPIWYVQYASEFFGRTITVYDQIGTLIFQSNFNSNFPVVELLLKDYHYSYIEKRFDGMFTCRKCRRVVVTPHVCQAKKCDNCFVWYITTHTNCNDSKVKYKRDKVTKMVSKIRVVGKDIFEANYSCLMNYVIVDLETFVDSTGEHRCYAAGWLNGTSKVFHYTWGQNCIKELIDDLVEISGYRKRRGLGKLIVVTFNGGNFDNFFLMPEMIRREWRMTWKLKTSTLVVLECDYFKCLDLLRFLPPCKLSQACKDAGCPPEWMKSHFPHKFIKKWEDLSYVGRAPGRNCYFDDPPEDWKFPAHWNLKEECLKYLALDCRATDWVFEKVSSIFFKEFNINITRFVTVTQAAYEVWTNTVAEQMKDYNGDTGFIPEWLEGIERCPFQIMVPDKEQFVFIKQAMVGGMAFPVKKFFCSKQYDKVQRGECGYMDVHDYILPLDVNGLYPYAMGSFDYPCGTPRWIDEGSRELDSLQTDLDNNRLGELLHGYYKVAITPNTSLVIPVFPSKKFEVDERNGDVFATSGLNWNLLPSTVVVSLVDLWRMRKAGYKLKLLRALVYPHSWKVFRTFIDKCKELKMRYDTADLIIFRSLFKLFMNALYGKTLEKPFTDVSILIRKREELDTFLAKHWWNDIFLLQDPKRTVLVQGTKKDLEEVLVKPYELGPYVTAWSRWTMDFYREINDPDMFTDPMASLNNTWYYTDTDCLHVRMQSEQDRERWKPHVKNEVGKMWYDLKNEEKVIRSIYIGPKCYALHYIDKNNKLGYKLRARSLKAKFLTWEDYEGTLFQSRTGDNAVRQDMEIIKRAGGKDINVEGFTYQPFSVLKLNIKRKLSSSEWIGRDFMTNLSSLPIGFSDPRFPSIRLFH